MSRLASWVWSGSTTVVNNLRVLGVVLVSCAILNGCPPPKVDPGPTEEELLALKQDRGRYLMNTLGGCTFCHTPLNPDGSRDNTRLFAGVDCFFDVDPTDPNVGCISTRNLTHHETGLMNATEEQIIDAFRNGVGTDGKLLAPVMPYWIFHNMTDEDAASIVAYLRTVPGVDHRIQPSQPPWIDLPGTHPPVTEEQIPMPRADYPEQDKALAGRYLAAKAGLCIDCHSPDPVPGSGLYVDLSRSFAGGRAFPAEALGLTHLAAGTLVYTANLTSDTTGLAGYTIEDIIRSIKGGVDKNGDGVCAATHGLSTSIYANLTEDDVTNIAHYLSSLPPVVNEEPAQCVAPVAR